MGTTTNSDCGKLCGVQLINMGSRSCETTSKDIPLRQTSEPLGDIEEPILGQLDLDTDDSHVVDVYSMFILSTSDD